MTCFPWGTIKEIRILESYLSVAPAVCGQHAKLPRQAKSQTSEESEDFLPRSISGIN